MSVWANWMTKEDGTYYFPLQEVLKVTCFECVLNNCEGQDPIVANGWDQAVAQWIGIKLVT
jgi:hypothetical protein